MTTQAKITFETLVRLVEDLLAERQERLIERIQEHIQQNNLTIEEKLELFRSAQIDIPINQEPSPRREDWYDEYGR